MNLGHTIGTNLRDAVREEPHTDLWQQVGTTVIRQVRETVTALDPVRYEIWRTADDERTCPICGQLDGEILVAGEGFAPPLHDHCRCVRAYHHTKFRTRSIEQWRDVAVTTTSWRWRHD